MLSYREGLVTLNDSDTLLVQRSIEYEHFTDTIQTNWIRRFIRNELLRELFSPRNHKNGHTTHYWTFQSTQKLTKKSSVSVTEP